MILLLLCTGTIVGIGVAAAAALVAFVALVIGGLLVCWWLKRRRNRHIHEDHGRLRDQYGTELDLLYLLFLQIYLHKEAILASPMVS